MKSKLGTAIDVADGEIKQVLLDYLNNPFKASPGMCH